MYRYTSTMCYIANSYIGKSVHLLLGQTTYDMLYVTICQLFTTVSSSDFVQDTAQNAAVLVGNQTTVVIASIHFKVVIVNMTLFSK